MAKFIVRDEKGEFWTCLAVETIEAATAHMVEVVRKLRAIGENLVYTIEPEPVAPMFVDWEREEEAFFEREEEHFWNDRDEAGLEEWEETKRQRLAEANEY